MVRTAMARRRLVPRRLPVVAVLAVLAALVGGCSNGDDEAPPADGGAGTDAKAGTDGGSAQRSDGGSSSGVACTKGSDCASDVCTSGVCQAPTDTDHVRNGGETGVDCGGAGTPGSDGAPACSAGDTCTRDTDCTVGVCDHGLCASGSPTDGEKDGDETDVDCGGAATPGSDGAPPCGSGQACLVASDCSSAICTANTCVAPSPSDGIKNGGETDVDCGGADTAGSDGAPACADAKTCGVDDDCQSAFCGTTTKICVDGQSCKATNGSDAAGIDTCGVGETGAAGAQHESCCKSLPLPGSAARVDKYEVTAGRMRQFITAVGPDIQSWVNGQISSGTTAGQTLSTQIPSAARGFLPTTDDPTQPLNLILQLGAGVGVMNTDQPSAEQGCFNADGAYGAATYWEPSEVLSSFGVPARYYSQAHLDEKPMNCTPYWMLAAFCAWDGGSLPTLAQQSALWGGEQYPWGSSFWPNPYPTSHVQDFTTTVNYFNNTELFYHFPDYSSSTNHNDNSGYISAPGRFALDATSATSANGESWMDVGADMMELAATSGNAVGSPFCDYSGLGGGNVSSQCNYTDGSGNYHSNGILRSQGLPVSQWMGGSWEGHYKFSQTDQPFFDQHDYTLGLDVQYGKTGARCARPAE
jgi:hypothetical protein